MRLYLYTDGANHGGILRLPSCTAPRDNYTALHIRVPGI